MDSRVLDLYLEDWVDFLKNHLADKDYDCTYCDHMTDEEIAQCAYDRVRHICQILRDEGFDNVH